MERRVADGMRGRGRCGALLGVLGLLLMASADGGLAGDEAMKLEITSPAFEAGGEIPTRFTCEGEDVSPPLAWSGVPAGTQSLVLIVDDPDAPDPKAPRTTWVHWVLFDLPPGSGGLAEGAAAGALPEGTRVGRNDWKRRDYGGPCPPIGRHRYFHELYALDTKLDLDAPDKAEVERAMEGHVLARAELVGTYEKHARQLP
jgi:hypothetical protein